MRLGLRQLRLHPRDFWALTPAELMLMAGLDAGAGPLTRDRLNDLAARYPDRRKDQSMTSPSEFSEQIAALERALASPARWWPNSTANWANLGRTMTFTREVDGLSRNFAAGCGARSMASSSTGCACKTRCAALPRP